MTWLYAAQFGNPVILIAWLALLPPQSNLGFMIQVCGSVAALSGVQPPTPLQM